MTSGAAYDDTHAVGVPDRFQAGAPEAPESTPAVTAQAGEGLARIRAHDPNFDLEAFRGALETLFLVVQEAWMECRPELARSVMSGPLLDRTLERLAWYAANRRRRVLEGIAVGEVDIVGVASEGDRDSVTARFRIASADYDVDAQSGRFLGGEQEVLERWEDWLFQRSSMAQTAPGGGTMNRRCPSCQAPLTIDDQGFCQYCHQPVMNGEHDWVLTAITRVG